MSETAEVVPETHEELIGEGEAPREEIVVVKALEIITISREVTTKGNEAADRVNQGEEEGVMTQQSRPEGAQAINKNANM